MVTLHITNERSSTRNVREGGRERSVVRSKTPHTSEADREEEIERLET